MGASRRAITCHMRWESNPPPMTGRWWSRELVDGDEAVDINDRGPAIHHSGGLYGEDDESDDVLLPAKTNGSTRRRTEATHGSDKLDSDSR